MARGRINKAKKAQELEINRYNNLSLEDKIEYLKKFPNPHHETWIEYMFPQVGKQRSLLKIEKTQKIDERAFYKREKGRGKIMFKHYTPEMFGGDDSSAYKGYLKSNVWKEVRKRVLKKAGYKCRHCKSTESLQIHHKTYERLYNEYYQDLEVLCSICHKEHHIIEGDLH